MNGLDCEDPFLSSDPWKQVVSLDTAKTTTTTSVTAALTKTVMMASTTTTRTPTTMTTTAMTNVGSAEVILTPMIL